MPKKSESSENGATSDLFDLDQELTRPENYIHSLIKEIKLSAVAEHLIQTLQANQGSGYHNADLEAAIELGDPQHGETFSFVDKQAIEKSVMGSVVISRAMRLVFNQVTNALSQEIDPTRDVHFFSPKLPKNINNRTHLFSQLSFVVETEPSEGRSDVELKYGLNDRERVWLYLFHEIKIAIDQLFENPSTDYLLDFAIKKLKSLFPDNEEEAKRFLLKGLGTALTTITEFERLIDEIRDETKIPSVVPTVDILENSYYLAVRFALFDMSTFSRVVTEGMADKELYMNSQFFRLNHLHNKKWILAPSNPQFLKMQVKTISVKTRCIALIPDEILNSSDKAGFENSVDAIFKMFIKLRRKQLKDKESKQ
jgi:hypothetical protein